MDDIDDNPKNQLTEQQFLESYPKDRQGRFFGMRLIRSMFHEGAFASLSKIKNGKNAAILVMFIASQEDRFHYRPVKFWNDDLSEALGFSKSSRKTLIGAKKVAREHGWLAYWSQHNRDQAYYYSLNPLENGASICSQDGTDTAISSRNGTNTSAICSSTSSQKGTNEHLICSSICSPISSQKGTPTNLLTNLEIEPTSKPKSAIGYTDEFDSFWNVFPSIRKTGKKEAFAAWKKALKETAKTECPHPDGWPSHLIQRASDYAQSATGQGEYAKMPSTWLNKGCWDDPAEAWVGTAKGNGRHASQAVGKKGVL